MYTINYAKLTYQRQRHHERYINYVEKHGLYCQDCEGYGAHHEVILDDGTGPWYTCGWCEGTGKVTRWVRGMWLRYMKDVKHGKVMY